MVEGRPDSRVEGAAFVSVGTRSFVEAHQSTHRVSPSITARRRALPNGPIEAQRGSCHKYVPFAETRRVAL
jgi:hypothetical protein